MFNSFMHYLWLIVVLGRVGHWNISWNKGVPMASTACDYRDDVMATVRYESGTWCLEHWYDGSTTAKSLVEALDPFWTNLNTLSRPGYCLAKKLQEIQGRIYLRYLLSRLSDGGEWSKWGDDSFSIHSNKAGWKITHRKYGKINAENRRLHAQIDYCDSGWIGIWFFQPGQDKSLRWKHNPSVRHTRNVFKAVNCVV